MANDDDPQRPENRGETGEPLGPGPGVRTAEGRFAGGSTGNAGGRPKTPKEFTELARGMSEMVLKKLYTIALGGTGNPAVRAGEIILERAWGRPPLHVTGPKGGPIGNRFHGAVRNAIEELVAQAEAAKRQPELDLDQSDVPKN
jgi:hypothetical protein